MLSRLVGICMGIFLFIVFSFSSFAKTSDDSFSKNMQSTHDTLHDLKTITIDNEYSVDIQKHLLHNDSLNSDASLQYADSSNELYIIVISESKSEFIQAFKDSPEYKSVYSTAKNYRIIEMADMKSKMEIIGKEHVKSKKIHGLSSQVVDFSAKNIQGVIPSIYYKTAFIEGQKNMYLVMAWTLLELKEKNEMEMSSMINSFRLTN